MTYWKWRKKLWRTESQEDIKESSIQMKDNNSLNSIRRHKDCFRTAFYHSSLIYKTKEKKDQVYQAGQTLQRTHQICIYPSCSCQQGAPSSQDCWERHHLLLVWIVCDQLQGQGKMHHCGIIKITINILNWNQPFHERSWKQCSNSTEKVWQMGAQQNFWTLFKDQVSEQAQEDNRSRE